MLTQENEYYIRLILLLLRGGTLVLKLTFMKRLADRGLQLYGFLQINKEIIRYLKEGKVLTLKQFNILFPINCNKAKLCELDISLLSCLLLNLFGQSLQKPEEKAIESIRTFRNDFAAHHPDGCVDARTFFRKWNQLSTLIINLGNGLSSSERSDLVELIKCVGEDPIDIKHAIEHIKDATGTTDQFMEHVSQLLEHLSVTVQQLSSRQDEISNVLQDTHTDIKELRSKNCNISTVIVGEVTVSSNNPEAVITAANLLIEHTKRSQGLIRRLSTVIDSGRRGVTHTVSSFFARVKGYFWEPEVGAISEAATKQSPSQRSVTALVQDIHNAGGEVIDVTEGSVLLHIQCNSIIAVLGVLKYFQSSDLEQRWSDIAQCLTEELGCRINLSACVQLQSLQDTFHLIQEKQSPIFTKRVRLSIKCQNTEGALDVVNLFEDGNVSDRLSTMSEDFSNELGSPVKLRASIDTAKLHENVNATGGTELEQEETVRGSSLESFLDKEAGGAVSKVSLEKFDASVFDSYDRLPSFSIMPFTRELSRNQSYEMYISNLKREVYGSEFVAFLDYRRDDEEFVEVFVIEELNATFQSLTGVNRDLICTKQKHFRPGFRTFHESIKLLRRSSVLIVLVTENISDRQRFCMGMAYEFGMYIIPMIMEEDEDKVMLLLKRFRNVSKVRIIWKIEHGEYILKTPWKEVCKDILKLAACKCYF